MDSESARRVADRVMDEVALLQEAGLDKDQIKKVVARLIQKNAGGSSDPGTGGGLETTEGLADLIWEGEK